VRFTAGLKPRPTKLEEFVGAAQAVPWRETAFSALLTEGHPSEFFLDAPAFGRVRGLGEPVGERKDALLFGLFRLEASLDQVHENSIGAGLASLGDGMDVFGNSGGKGNALADGFSGFGIELILH
jgi:hypothetical protein